jgi:hypothetical protein
MTINFFRGHPTESLLPNKSIIEATTTLLNGPRPYDKGELSQDSSEYLLTKQKILIIDIL